jgi:predicted RNase H-related nuclease YkuK (DUF458 family)
VYAYLIFGAKTMHAIPKLFFRMGKRTCGEMESEDELVEKHDGVFAGPLMMFPTFPHNITFEESRETIIQANPTDDDAETYMFIHNRQEFGILRTEDATISANIQLVAPTGVNIANTQIIGVMLKPLALGWKTKEVYVNNDVINPTSTHESELQYISYLLTQSPTGTKDKEGLCLGYRDTPANFNNSSGFHALVFSAGFHEANGGDTRECYDNDEDDNVEENFEEGDNLEEGGGMSDRLFSKVLSELITLKSRSEVKKHQSKVIPCAKKFLGLSMSKRSKAMTQNVRKNLLHICDYVYQGKFQIDISNDNLRFLRHLLDKRTPKEDVDVGLTEDLRTHAIIREVIDLVEKNGVGARKKPRTR